MSWQTRLTETISHKGIKINVEQYMISVKEVIRPGLKEINKILSEHLINTTVNTSPDGLIFFYGREELNFTIEFEDNKIKITSIYCVPKAFLFNENEPLIRESISNLYDIEGFTQDKLGEIFLDAFLKMRK